MDSNSSKTELSPKDHPLFCPSLNNIDVSEIHVMDSDSCQFAGSVLKLVATAGLYEP